MMMNNSIKLMYNNVSIYEQLTQVTKHPGRQLSNPGMTKENIGVKATTPTPADTCLRQLITTAAPRPIDRR